jgi:Methionine biosynthesis protein MetW
VKEMLALIPRWQRLFGNSRGRRLLAAARTCLRRSDVARWTRNAHEIPHWDDRNVQIARLIPDKSSVLDLGAGARTLRGHLKPGCTYQPCDLIPSGPDVIVCDFNRGIFPDLPPRSFDYVICSGVFEYMWRPGAMLERIHRYGRQLILTYNLHQPGNGIVDRLAVGWVNHLTRSELDELFRKCGLNVRLVAPRSPAELIFVLDALSVAG